MAHYRFESEWKLSAPIDRVFDLLSQPEGFARWWPAVRSSLLTDSEDATGLGARAQFTVRSPLLYSMTFATTAVEIDRPHRIHNLVRGDLVGTGTYELTEEAHGTLVRLAWRVSTTKPWMNRLPPFARPLFVWAHRRVMEGGAKAMAEVLDSELLHSDVATKNELAVGRPRKALGQR